MRHYDLIVLGGGVAGVSAALSASRKGLRTVIIEKGSMLGGLATSGLINWFEPLCDGRGNQLLFSQCEEFFALACEYGYSTLDPNWKASNKRKSSWFDHNLFALSLNRLMKDNNIDVYYESSLVKALVKDKIIQSVDILTVEGILTLEATQYIDASGNAALARLCGIEVREGMNYLTYATTTYKNGISQPVFQYSGSGLDGTGHPEGMQTFNGLKQEDVNRYLKEGQLLCLKEYEEGKIKDVSMLPSMPQFRKIASIQGEYCLTKEDLFKHQDDSIGVIGVFNRPGQYYEIPLGCLYSKKIDNLFAAGRIISSDDEGWEAIRVIPIGILTGEVAGLCSFLSLKHRFSYPNLEQELKQRGIKIHY